MKQVIYFEVWSQNDCQWCDKAKVLLAERGCKVVEYNLSTSASHAKEQFKSHHKTVPQIYVHGYDHRDHPAKEHVGGHDDLVKWLETYMPVSDHVLVKRLSPTAIIPTRGSELAIGLDLYADLGIGETIIVPPNEIKRIPTGIAMQPPEGHYLRVAPRSGLAVKGLDVLAGVIDRDYTGEISVVLANHNYENVEIAHGMRVAQVISERASIFPVMEVKNLSATNRGEKGFGSTGA